MKAGAVTPRLSASPSLLRKRAQMHSEHNSSTHRRQGTKSYSAKQRQILARHMSDPDVLAKCRETLTGGEPFVRRGHTNPFPGRTNADLFASVGASSLRSAAPMSVEDEKLFAGVRLRSWGRIELEHYRFAYQPTWFATWVGRVVADVIPDKRVSRAMVDFAWGFFAAERSEALTQITYEEFSAHYGVARSTVGIWLRMLREARIIESAHTWAEDNGKTSQRRTHGRKHARCYAANLYRLGSAVAEEVRIAIREGRSGARFCSGKSMEWAARNCGQALRAQMRAEHKERRDLKWITRETRTSGLPSSLSRPIFGCLRPSVPSGSMTPPRDGAASEGKERPAAVSVKASPAGPTDRVTPCDSAARLGPAASGRKDEHDAERASTIEAQKKTSPNKPLETSSANGVRYKAQFDELVKRGLAHFRRGMHAIVFALLVAGTACGNWISHASDNNQQYQRLGRLGASARTPGAPHDPRRIGAFRDCAPTRWQDFVEALCPRTPTPRGGDSHVDGDGDSAKAQPSHGPRVVRERVSMNTETENSESEDESTQASGDKTYPSFAGTLAADGSKVTLAAILPSDSAIATWELDTTHIVRLTRVYGVDKDTQRINARIFGAVSAGKRHASIPGRVGPGLVQIGVESMEAESIHLALECTRLDA